MMYFPRHKMLAVILGGLLIFSACKKDSDSGPAVEPLSVAAVKPDDILTIKGQNFDANASGNIVKFGDVIALVVSATETEIKVKVPGTSATGTIYTLTVTAHGKTTEVGVIAIVPLTFYAVKGTFASGAEYKVITINPGDGSESLIASVGERINDVVYLAATNEIVGVNDAGTKLVKVNVTTKKVSSVALPSGATAASNYLVVDKDNNLYCIKYDYTVTNHQTQSLVKIDPVTGNATVIKTFESTDDWYEPVYVAATNEVIGLKNEGKSLFKLNLTTKDTLTVNLPGSATTEYRELIVDDESNLFAYKAHLHGDPTDVAKLVKVNAATGEEKLVKDLPVNGKFHDKIIYVSKLSEFLGIWDQLVVFRLNMWSLTYDFSPNPPTLDNTYTNLTSN
ncbi:MULTISPECIES: IPT/TIG domain-containing protein [Niastella]|uniref:IPT/TIG domain-containing protein n=1 Tax=Niastella soli TaxID=2821487 RepID=A0ABS3YS60_9BACT|nr:IPT/TIG domain-containing protein [Niastella soli]MBO9200623.1 IPT/TIG domain-containing protein [Niastella soli]